MDLFPGYIMAETNIEILSILRYCFKLNDKAGCKIQNIEGNNKISNRTAKSLSQS